MSETMKIAATTVASKLLRLPWHIPLEQWPDDLLAALPQGISRHIVRFVNLDDRVIAVKEIGEFTAHPVSYTHLTLPTIAAECRSRWSPYH